MPNGPRLPCPGSFTTRPDWEEKRREVLLFEYGLERIKEGLGALTTRLVTYADISQPSTPEDVSVPVRHVLQLADGRSVVLLSDRGFGSSGSWADESVERIERNARWVVGPDEPPAGRTKEEEASLHWAYLQRIAQQSGVTISADELRHLPHHVVLSDRLLARIGAGTNAK